MNEGKGDGLRAKGLPRNSDFPPSFQTKFACPLPQGAPRPPRRLIGPHRPPRRPTGGPPPRPSSLPLARARPRFACGAAIGCGGEAGGFPLRAAGIPVRRLADSDSCSRTERPARPGHRPGPAPTPPPTPPPPGSPRRGGRVASAAPQPLEGSRSPACPPGGRDPCRCPHSGAVGRCRFPRGCSLGRGHLSSRPGLLVEAPACASGEILRERFKGLPARDVTSDSWGTAFPLSSRACIHRFSNQLLRGT